LYRLKSGTKITAGLERWLWSGVERSALVDSWTMRAGGRQRVSDVWASGSLVVEQAHYADQLHMDQDNIGLWGIDADGEYALSRTQTLGGKLTWRRGSDSRDVTTSQGTVTADIKKSAWTLGASYGQQF
jgi:hypothetical protein